MQILIKIAELGINLTIEMTDQVLNKLRGFFGHGLENILIRY